MTNTLYLINPLSNDKYAPVLWRKIQKKYSFLPEKPEDITKISDLSIYLEEKKPSLVVIAGGDGTINSVCNQVRKMKNKPTLAVIPLGFGNAISFSLGVDTIEKAIYVLTESKKTLTIDLFETNVPQFPIGFFNISIGFDAQIVHNRMNYRYIGFRSYILSALRSLVSHKENRIRFTIDHMVNMEATASTLVIANTPVIGGNVLASDFARLNDGYLDCTLFASKFTYLRNLRLRGFKHPLYSELGKVHFKAKHIRVEGEPLVQIDGDPVVITKPLEIQVLPEQITFLRNSREAIDQSTQSFV